MFSHTRLQLPPNSPLCSALTPKNQFAQTASVFLFFFLNQTVSLLWPVLTSDFLLEWWWNWSFWLRSWRPYMMWTLSFTLVLIILLLIPSTLFMLIFFVILKLPSFPILWPYGGFSVDKAFPQLLVCLVLSHSFWLPASVFPIQTFYTRPSWDIFVVWVTHWRHNPWYHTLPQSPSQELGSPWGSFQPEAEPHSWAQLKWPNLEHIKIFKCIFLIEAQWIYNIALVSNT